jgi:predicted metalloprotease with PDZ domain
MCIFSKFFLPIFIFIFTSKTLNPFPDLSTEIFYTISFKKPFTHYCEVEIKVPLEELRDSLIFSMPSWTPGSYLIRDYARNVEQVKAAGDNGNSLEVAKINKNSWKVSLDKQRKVIFRYKVYCNEMSVRTSEINDDHAFLCGAGTFMYVKSMKDRSCVLKINKPSSWKKVSTGLNKTSSGLLTAENYDKFIDCPIEIGNQKIIEFDIEGVKYYVSVYGEGNYSDAVVVEDIKKIVNEQINFFREAPFKEYTFLIRLAEKRGGGLEHTNSFSVIVERWSFNDEELYKKFLSLVSHEFFHLWNGKRIVPKEFYQYDYDSENYTECLWVIEGWTTFYGDVLVKRCGLFNKEDYFKFVEKLINDVLRYQGKLFQSLEESSFDTWIKFYKKDENYQNASISYYTKGALVALMLNLEIMKSTDAEYSLDDVIRKLYEDYKASDSKEYTNEKIKKLCEDISGKDFTDFWNRYIKGTEEIPLDEYLNYAGLTLENEHKENYVSLDIETAKDNNKLIVSKVYAGGSGYESGLNANDKILTINNIEVTKDDLGKRLQDFNIGDIIKVTVLRKGSLKYIDVEILSALPKFKVQEMEDKSDLQTRILNKWIKG